MSIIKEILSEFKDNKAMKEVMDSKRAEKLEVEIKTIYTDLLNHGQAGIHPKAFFNNLLLIEEAAEQFKIKGFKVEKENYAGCDVSYYLVSVQ